MPSRSSSDAEQLARLDEVSRVELGLPYAFIARVRTMTFAVGEAGALVDDHRAAPSVA